LLAEAYANLWELNILLDIDNLRLGEINQLPGLAYLFLGYHFSYFG